MRGVDATCDVNRLRVRLETAGEHAQAALDAAAAASIGGSSRCTGGEHADGDAQFQESDLHSCSVVEIGLMPVAFSHVNPAASISRPTKQAGWPAPAAHNQPLRQPWPRPDQVQSRRLAPRPAGSPSAHTGPCRTPATCSRRDVAPQRQMHCGTRQAPTSRSRTISCRHSTLPASRCQSATSVQREPWRWLCSTASIKRSPATPSCTSGMLCAFAGTGRPSLAAMICAAASRYSWANASR